jgi:addiction module HigA family antidote
MHTTLKSLIITEKGSSAMKTTVKTVRPVHPGEMLREDFLPDYGMTASTFAAALGVSRQTVNELLNERRAVTPVMALSLSRLFGNTPQFWLNAQAAVDLWDARRSSKAKLSRIRPLTAA